MRYVVHVGQTKAGSTTIQAFLGANYDRLRENGIYYPNGQHYPRQIQHSWISAALNDNPERVEELLRECRGHSTAVISGEILINIAPTGLRKFHDMLVRTGGADDISIIVYVRNSADRLLSKLAQRSKHGKGLYPEILDYLVQLSDKSSISERITQLEAVFGEENVDVRLVEEAESLEADFMQAAGLPWVDSYRIPQWANVSPDPITAQTLTLLHIEFGLWNNAARVIEKGLRLPHLENTYLRQFAPLVAKQELRHPKLARFGEQLTEIRWRDESQQPELTAYLERLIRSLTRLRDKTAARRAAASRRERT